MQTYNVDTSTPDSAVTGTAYLCGVKANMETIGVTDKVKFGNCSAVTDETKVRSIVKESIAQGKLSISSIENGLKRIMQWYNLALCIVY